MAKCDHCGTSGAENKWHPSVCADGRKKRSKALCNPCDHMLNRLVLEFFNFKNVDELMREYTGGQELWGQQSKRAIP